MELKVLRSLLGFLILGIGTVCLYLLYVPNVNYKDLFDGESALNQIVFHLRLPRLFFLLGVGGGLSVLGGAYQVLFRNSLAEPYVLGISSSVSLAVAVCQNSLGQRFESPFIIALGCLVGLLTSLFLLALVGKQTTERLILFGMSLNFVLSSLLFLYLTYASQQLGGGSMQWLFGHIPWVSFGQSGFLLVFSFLFLAGMLVFGRYLDAMSLGDLVAKTMGVSPSVTRSFVVLVSSIFLGVVVSQTGSIGFIGLVIPHAVRLIFAPSSSRKLFIFSFFLGAIFLAVCDFLSRNILPPLEFPIGIITTLVGAPLFLWLLWKR